jgi:hypothetical protein
MCLFSVEQATLHVCLFKTLPLPLIYLTKYEIVHTHITENMCIGCKA